ncbi:MAG: hypothetical protein RL757_2175 [Bacteroidota bacterium]|jgi:hypothetical protein
MIFNEKSMIKKTSLSGDFVAKSSLYIEVFISNIIFNLIFKKNICFFVFTIFIMKSYFKLLTVFSATLIATSILLSCQSDPKTPAANQIAAPPAIVLPSTPEEVVKMWETNYDQNNFALIEPISFGEGLKLVRANEATNQMAIKKGESIGSFTPNIVQVTCEIKGENCDCICLINDPSVGKYNMKYELLRDNGQWKVVKSGDEKASEKSNSKDSKNPL